ncbi:MAG TPA: tripartite tricarboxylate transporter substrate binding protein [Candidatus Methylomirabilis sp.]|jgi:tripartite-type tricarboxylate transporter receptor subunit TctC|nr:tripartite tricarboxylate transporter substrate binding protein [Candidatus Methylomirabilis sp.]
MARKRLFTPVALLLGVLLAGLLVPRGSGRAEAPDFPTRPITFVVGFSPGGGADVFARALAEAAKTALPQPLVVENRPGAGGTAANAYASGRPADGHTILFAHAGSSILTPIITNQAQLKWDAFEPVARIHAEEEWLFVHPDAPWKTIDALAAYAKANPRQVRVAGSAIGGIDSFTVLSWEKAAGIDVEYIPHEGGGPATLAFLGKNAEVLVGNVSEVFQHIEAKKMVPVAVASEKRSPIFPDVPTLKEKGWNVVMVQWRSVLAPKGTPAPRVAALAAALQKAMGAEAWKTFNRNAKAVDLYLSPAAFRQFLASEEKRFTAIIEELGLRKK